MGAVEDWQTDFDHTDPQWAANAPQIWDELRGECPVAHTERFGQGCWLPTRHEDVSAVAHDTEHYSSRGVLVADHIVPIEDGFNGGFAPPITSDPPFHAAARRLLLPAFAPRPIKALEDNTRQLCNGLIDTLIEQGPEVDAATGYSQTIPVAVIANMLGVPAEDGDKFRFFLKAIIELPGSHDEFEYEDSLDAYLDQAIDDHRQNPKDDLIGALIDSEIDGEPLTNDHIRGSVALILLAGIDTTWSAIGASLWHLAKNPADRKRLAEQPDLIDSAVEEFLRAYAPVTMARVVDKETTLGGRDLSPGDWLLLPFPAANRDPEVFEDADKVILDRKVNRHAAFGLGIHRCVGSNLARLEMKVAIGEFMRRIPDFELRDDTEVRWSTGQIRGPRELPIRILATS